MLVRNLGKSHQIQHAILNSRCNPADRLIAILGVFCRHHEICRLCLNVYVNHYPSTDGIYQMWLTGNASAFVLH